MKGGDKKMFGNLLRSTRRFWGLLMLLFAFFLLVTAYGGRQIYEGEKQALRHEVDVNLHLAEDILKAAFADLSEELQFLWSQPAIAALVENGFAGEAERREILNLFHHTVLTHKSYHKVALIGSDGIEVIGVDSGKGALPIISQGQKHAAKVYDQCLTKSRQLGKGQTCVMSALINNDEPGLIVSTGLFDDNGKWQGVLTLSLGLSKVLSLLPENTFIQSKDNRVLPNDAAKANFSLYGPWNFIDEQGTITVSDTEIIHYKRINFLPEQQLLVGFFQNTGSVKKALWRLTLIFLCILSVFFALLAVLNYTRSSQFKEMIEAQRSIVFSLANLAEWRDLDTGQHLERTRNFGVLLAKELRKNKKFEKRIDQDFLADMYDAAPLHDLGKVGIADGILLKPGKLTAQEYEKMQQHVHIGKDIIENVINKLERPESFLVMSRNIAHYHHEKFDGSGYPEQLRGEQIPLEARIYALCDAYDAIRTRRPYKGPKTHLEAVERIFVARGTHFDCDVANAFLDCEREFMEVYEAYMLYDEVYKRIFKGRDLNDLDVVWSDDFEVGISFIDQQHRELISRINTLFHQVMQGTGKEETLRMIHFLKDYIVEHFAAEEQYMQSHNYSDYKKHKAMHDQFIVEFTEVVQQVESEGISSDFVIVVNKRVVNWLVSHIFLVDKGIEAICAQSSS